MVSNTVIVVCLNTTKTNLDLNFVFYQAFKQHGYRIQINIETKRSRQLTASIGLRVNLNFEKSLLEIQT